MADIIKIVPKEKAPADDIVRMLREMADSIEEGDYGNTLGSVFILATEDNVICFGWGEDVQTNRDIAYLVGVANKMLYD